MSIRGPVFAAAAAALAWVVPIAAQAPLAVSVEDRAPRVVMQGVLRDQALESAVRSGLPLRLQFRLELWRDQLFDHLVGDVTWSAVLAYEPLGRRFVAGQEGDDSLASYPSFEAARGSLETVYRPRLVPDRGGRYYYIALLEVETLSLSDLDELERWLRGDLGPAVQGEGSVPGAVGTGLKRLLIRVLDLPARRYEARSGRFRVP